MKSAMLRFGNGFKVLMGNGRTQAARMVIKPGEAEGNRDNRHHGADQWLLVVSGSGVATINGRRHVLRPGRLLLIERDDRHEIRNTGAEPLKTLNFYVPPAYCSDGDELRPAKPGEGPR
jgi:mannose-6-phosphate isomerase-like protein (cupin superfamily)